MYKRQVWHALITDETKALEFFCQHGPTRAALLAICLKEASAMARREKCADAAPAGCAFYSDEKAL